MTSVFFSFFVISCEGVCATVFHCEVFVLCQALFFASHICFSSFSAVFWIGLNMYVLKWLFSGRHEHELLSERRTLFCLKLLEFLIKTVCRWDSWSRRPLLMNTDKHWYTRDARFLSWVQYEWYACAKRHIFKIGKNLTFFKLIQLVTVTVKNTATMAKYIVLWKLNGM